MPTIRQTSDRGGIRRIRMRPTRRGSRIAGLTAAILTIPFLPLATEVAWGAPGDVTVTTDRDVYTVEEGSAARIGVTATVEGGGALSSDVVVSWATRTGSATDGSDYTGAGGEITFAAGSASGTTQYVEVQTLADQDAETAETVPISVTTRSSGVTVTGSPTLVINANGLPYLDPRLPVAQRVADLMSRMTLEEKVGQMTQAERGSVTDNQDEIANWLLGSVLSGGGSTPATNTPEAWADMVDQFQSHALQTRLQIPMIYGIDAVHGHGNVLGATIFPHNVGMGSTRDPGLVAAAGRVTAAEVKATGIPWDFAPCVCVARDDRWGRTYESFGEDPALVISMETIIDGLQGRRAGQWAENDHVMATSKHYAGDGDTEYGTAAGDYKIDQGITVTSRPDFWRIDLAPYGPAIRRHHTGSVMPSFSSVDWTEDGVGNPIKMHANRELITDVLKGRLHFGGFVISDWEGIHQIPGDWPTQVRTGANAGIDMFMEPSSFREFETTLLAEVRSGGVSQARINDAVRRILTRKFQLGLFEHPYADRTNLDQIGSAAHRDVARRAAAESQVLLKNAGGVLPLAGDAKVYVAGRNANNMGNQNGGWTLTWQGFSGNNSQPGTTILQGIREVAPDAQVTFSEDASAPMTGSDVGVVVVGETPYAEGFGDVGGPLWAYDPADNGQPREPKTMELKDGDRAVIDKVCSAVEKCVVLVVSGRPQVIGDQLGDIDALVASWLPGTEGAGVADVLFGKRPFTGQLSLTWPRSADQEPINVGDASYDPAFPFGWGLRTDSARARLAHAARASADVRAALAVSGGWTASGAVQDAAAVVPLLVKAAASLHGSDANAVVSVVRDVAQQAIAAGNASVPSNALALVADADRKLLTGRASAAAWMLAKAAGV